MRFTQSALCLTAAVEVEGPKLSGGLPKSDQPQMQVGSCWVCTARSALAVLNMRTHLFTALHWAQHYCNPLVATAKCVNHSSRMVLQVTGKAARQKGPLPLWLAQLLLVGVYGAVGFAVFQAQVEGSGVSNTAKLMSRRIQDYLHKPQGS